jgi:hypothetical protein
MIPFIICSLLMLLIVQTEYSISRCCGVKATLDVLVQVIAEVTIVGSRYFNPSHFLLFYKAANTPCLCSVPDAYIRTIGVRKILEDTTLFEKSPNYLNYDDETLLKVLRLLQDPGVVGEMYTSSGELIFTVYP